METIAKQFKQILLTTMLLLCAATSISQVKHKAARKPLIATPVSKQLKDFYVLASDAGATFIFPDGFKEIPVVNDEGFSFDYAMEIPGSEFEIWFQVRSQKQDWINYEHLKNDPGKQIDSPDSLYASMGQAQSTAFTGDQNYLTRTIPQDILVQYNANAGKTYLLNIQDTPETKHYKYALLITLQKNHTGTIMAVCFTNDKGPEFFKNINKASKCMKFKP
jgi:hypothetical protein